MVVGIFQITLNRQKTGSKLTFNHKISSKKKYTASQVRQNIMNTCMILFPEWEVKAYFPLDV